ncbi:sensor histidine kinase [Idiomarina aquatica]|uniref:Transcriptional regulator n=1 Tax=Idiomarina aquatica TaxID=1327752 RepID=A0AA94JDA4_9GAMM|nr:histidine kinase [Idiomarina aquatica]RUO40286.1 transcriptional regulator [Idiomarina aquatica]
MSKLVERLRLFWFCQFCGWSIYALLTELLIKLPSDEPWQIHVPHLLLDVSSGFLITMGLHTFYKRAKRFDKYTVAAHVILIIVAALVWTQFQWYALQALYGGTWDPMSWFDFGTWTSASLTMLSAWTAVYYSIKNYLDNVEQRERAERATHLAKEAQLKMLRYQLNPHFMFNSINAICTLILKHENDRAVDMLEQLCDFLRYSLYTDPLKKIPVSEEAALLKTYLEIEKNRFQTALDVSITTDPDCEAALIPPLLIQPLVENVLKHGMLANQTMSIAVDFSASQEGIHIQVTDNGKGFEEQYHCQRGIGLDNCQQRLRLTYEDDAQLSMGNRPEGGAWVNILIPRELQSSAL